MNIPILRFYTGSIILISLVFSFSIIHQNIYSKPVVIIPKSIVVNNTNSTVIPMIDKGSEKSFNSKFANFESKMTTNISKPILNTPPYTITNSTITVMHQIINGSEVQENNEYSDKKTTTTEILNEHK